MKRSDLRLKIVVHFVCVNKCTCFDRGMKSSLLISRTVVSVKFLEVIIHKTPVHPA